MTDEIDERYEKIAKDFADMKKISADYSTKPGKNSSDADPEERDENIR